MTNGGLKMSNSNKVKAEKLGIPYGTAMNRLRKQLMFKYVKLAGDDICYACGERIETVDDLSVEHKEPWVNYEVERFWDLDNIAFSHLRCNIPHVYNGSPGQTWSMKAGPEGTAWCFACEVFLTIDLFNKNRSMWNGKDCDYHVKN